MEFSFESCRYKFLKRNALKILGQPDCHKQNLAQRCLRLSKTGCVITYAPYFLWNTFIAGSFLHVLPQRAGLWGSPLMRALFKELEICSWNKSQDWPFLLRKQQICGFREFWDDCLWQWELKSSWEGLFIMMVAFCLSLLADVITFLSWVISV